MMDATQRAYRLSKSKFMAGLQCHKRLYLDIHHLELATPFDEATQARFDLGHEVGALARQRYPGGVLITADRSQMQAALDETAALIADPEIPAIFEATFQHDDVLVRVDILERVGRCRWRLIEVKSTGSPKPEHTWDIAIQRHVLGGAGIHVDACHLMHLNTAYLYPGGAIDVRQLFTVVDITTDVRKLQGDVPTRLRAMRASLAGDAPPVIAPGPACHDPYDCPFWDHCTADKPARWIFHFPGGQRSFDKLTARRIHLIDAIPSGFPLSPHQQRVKDNHEWIGTGLKQALAEVTYPVYHLDFETARFAIPMIPNTRPYEQVPVQWSVHVEEKDGTVRHEEYLDEDPKDGREELTVRLLRALGKTGTICVYSSFEKTVLSKLAETCPAFQDDIEKVISRLWDVCAVLKAHYFHPGFGSSYSLKSVLPALIPSLDYDDLAIQDGDTTSQWYAEMISGECTDDRRAAIRDALLSYCARDTKGLRELRRYLEDVAGRRDAGQPIRAPRTHAITKEGRIKGGHSKDLSAVQP